MYNVSSGCGGLWRNKGENWFVGFSKHFDWATSAKVKLFEDTGRLSFVWILPWWFLALKVVKHNCNFLVGFYVFIMHFGKRKHNCNFLCPTPDSPILPSSALGVFNSCYFVVFSVGFFFLVHMLKKEKGKKNKLSPEDKEPSMSHLKEKNSSLLEESPKSLTCHCWQHPI